MGQLFTCINFQGKLSPEHHVLLWLFKRSIDKNPDLKYKDFIITEKLIKQYNHCLSGQERQNILDLIGKNKKLMDDFLADFSKTPWEFSKPVIWNDRNKSAYFINNLMMSHKFEVYIDTLFLRHGIDIGLYYSKEGQYDKGESEKGIEIKCDMESNNTGNIYIEYAEKLDASNSNWVSSGIFKKDNTKYFLTGTMKKFWIISKQRLIDLYNELMEHGTGEGYNKRLKNGIKLANAHTGTSLGFVIPKTRLGELEIPFENIIKVLKQCNK